MTINPVTGFIHWAPTAAQVGTHDVTIKADDGRGGTATQTYRICVLAEEGNCSPVFFSQPNPTVLPAPFGTCDPLMQ